MFTKFICYTLIFSLLVPDLARAGKDFGLGEPEKRHRSLSVQLKKVTQQTSPNKKHRPRAQSLPDYHVLSKNGNLIPKIKPQASFDLFKEKSSKLDLDAPKDHSKSNNSTITSSSTGSSPRGDEVSSSSQNSTSSSPQNSTSSSPTKSSESFDMRDTDSHDVPLTIVDTKQSLKNTILSVSKNSELFLEKEPKITTSNKTLNEELQLKTEDEKTIYPLSDLVIDPLEKVEENIKTPQTFENKQPVEVKSLPELIEEIVGSGKIVITTVNNSPESLSVSPSTSTSSETYSQEKERTSTSRRNSDSSGDVEGSKSNKNVSLQDFPKMLDEVVSQTTENVQTGDSSSLLQDTNLGIWQNTELDKESVLPIISSEKIHEVGGESKEIILQTHSENEVNTDNLPKKVFMWDKIRQLNNQNKKVNAALGTEQGVVENNGKVERSSELPAENEVKSSSKPFPSSSSNSSSSADSSSESSDEFADLINKKSNNSDVEIDKKTDASGTESKTKPQTNNESEDLQLKRENVETTSLENVKLADSKINSYGSSAGNSDFEPLLNMGKGQRNSLNPFEGPSKSVLNIQGDGTGSWQMMNLTEEGGSNDSFLNVGNFDEQKKLNQRVLAFLIYAKDHINDGKITLHQGLVGGIGGTLIGIGVAIAMIPILNDGLTGLGKQFSHEINKDGGITATLFEIHTGLTLGTDTMVRSIIILGDHTGPSMEEFSVPVHKIKFNLLKCVDIDLPVTIDSRKMVLVFFYGGAGIAALLPVYYLWHVEEEIWTKYPAFKTNALYFFGFLTPTLFLDSLLHNGRAAKHWVDEKFNDYFIRQAYEGAHLFSARAIRETELKRFRDLERLFLHTPDDEIHDLYEQVLVHGFNLKENNMDFPEETLKAEETIRTLRALRQIHRDNQIPEEVKEEWKKITATLFGWGIPITALVGRSLVFFKIVYDLLNDIAPAYHDFNTGCAIVFGEIIAAFFQGKVEVDATKRAIYDLLDGEETEGDSSQNCLWKGLRKVGKGYNYLQGAWNTIPYILVGLQVTPGWHVALRFLTLMFFGLADTFNSAVAFNESYGGAIAGAESLLSYKYATAGYKRNKLRRLVRHYYKAYETMHPDVLMGIDAMCSKDLTLEEKGMRSFFSIPKNDVNDEL